MDTGQLPDVTSTRVTRADGAGGAEDGSRAQVQHGDQARLVFASFLMLFVELALIRWITSNNVYVTEATNFVLLASFLGIGIGFLNATSSRDYLRWTPLALLALVGLSSRSPSSCTPAPGRISSWGSGRSRRCRSRSVSH
jgi:hypothetical protein